jgi:hypothetical protein
MKKITTIVFLFLLPLFGFSQTVKVDTSKSKVVIINTEESESDDIYTERPFQGQQETIKVTPFTGLTDHEIFNLKLKMAAKKEKTLKNPK